MHALNIAARSVLCEIAADHMKSAARALRAARATNAARYVARARKSVDGAARHAHGRTFRETLKP